MSIEKTDRVYPSFSFNKVTPRKVAGDQSSFGIVQDADEDGFKSKDEQKIKNTFNDQAVKGADLDGDGVVSMKEALLTTLNSFDSEEVADKEAINTKSSEIYAKYRAELLKNQTLSQTNTEE
ncbi:MAG: hypothetical protein K9N55_04270 [Phycisphaerae bacterium]|nr:hypothetical protein [Phycisphaerae bacterium]